MTGRSQEDSSHRPKTREGLIFRQLDEEWVVYDSDGEQLHVLNGTAVLVWLHCNGDNSTGDIANAVGEVFDQQVDRSSLERDVTDTIAEFASKGLLA